MRALSFGLCCFLGLAPDPAASPGAGQAELYLIDAHSQVDETVDLDTVISLMDQAGIRSVILTSVGRRHPREIVRLSKQHPSRIIPSVRIKGPAYNENDSSFYTMLGGQVESGNFSAMSELMVYHAAKFHGAAEHRAPEIIVHPNDRRVQVALQYAIEKGWPFVVHIEFGSRTIGNRRQFMEELEAMLDAHPEHPFALAHMGQLDAKQVRRLIEAHRNIHFQTSRSDPWLRGRVNRGPTCSGAAR